MTERFDDSMSDADALMWAHRAATRSCGPPSSPRSSSTARRRGGRGRPARARECGSSPGCASAWWSRVPVRHRPRGPTTPFFDLSYHAAPRAQPRPDDRPTPSTTSRPTAATELRPRRAPVGVHARRGPARRHGRVRDEGAPLDDRRRRRHQAAADAASTSSATRRRRGPEPEPAAAPDLHARGTRDRTGSQWQAPARRVDGARRRGRARAGRAGAARRHRPARSARGADRRLGRALPRSRRRHRRRRSCNARSLDRRVWTMSTCRSTTSSARRRRRAARSTTRSWPECSAASSLPRRARRRRGRAADDHADQRARRAGRARRQPLHHGARCSSRSRSTTPRLASARSVDPREQLRAEPAVGITDQLATLLNLLPRRVATEPLRLDAQGRRLRHQQRAGVAVPAVPRRRRGSRDLRVRPAVGHVHEPHRSSRTAAPAASASTSTPPPIPDAAGFAEDLHAGFDEVLALR